MQSPQLLLHYSSRSKKKYDTNGDKTLVLVEDVANPETSGDDSDSDESGDESDNDLDPHDHPAHPKVHPIG